MRLRHVVHCPWLCLEVGWEEPLTDANLDLVAVFPSLALICKCWDDEWLRTGVVDLQKQCVAVRQPRWAAHSAFTKRMEYCLRSRTLPEIKSLSSIFLSWLNSSHLLRFCRPAASSCWVKATTTGLQFICGCETATVLRWCVSGCVLCLFGFVVLIVWFFAFFLTYLKMTKCFSKPQVLFLIYFWCAVKKLKFPWSLLFGLACSSKNEWSMMIIVREPRLAMFHSCGS